MPTEIWIILALAALFGGYGAYAGLTVRDSWDRRPDTEPGADSGADSGGGPAWDFHKATLGIYQEPGEEPWEKDLAALHFERKHPYC